jgi:hypothetical protein
MELSELEKCYRAVLSHSRAGGESLVTITASTKRALRILLNEPSTQTDAGALMLRLFGEHFSADEVAHLGRDVVEPWLQHSHVAVRDEAIAVLKKWMLQEPDGPWRRILEAHDARNGSSELERFCREYLSSGEHHVLDPQDSLDLGVSWDSAGWISASEKASNHVCGDISNDDLPTFFSRIVDLHPLVTLDLIEVARTGFVSSRSDAIQVETGLLQGHRCVAVHMQSWCLTMMAHGDGWSVHVYF